MIKTDSRHGTEEGLFGKYHLPNGMDAYADEPNHYTSALDGVRGVYLRQRSREKMNIFCTITEDNPISGGHTCLPVTIPDLQVKIWLMCPRSESQAS